MRHRTMTLAVAAAIVLGLAAPATAGGAEVTSGDVMTLSGGTELGYDIGGHATMRRVPGEGGKTIVTINVTGLDPNTTYSAHVHNAPCAATPPGGGHYKHDPDGLVDPVNEMWPAIATNAAGNGTGKATHGWWARDDAMSIVIHYPPFPAIRLACVDLD